MSMLLSIRDLTVTYPGRRGPVPAVREVSLSLEPGRVLGVAGESGCGKSTLAHAVLRLLPRAAEVHGQVLLDGEDVLAASWGRLRALRWAAMAVALQNNALNPVRRIAAQIAEPLRLHATVPGAAVPGEVGRLLERVSLPASSARAYPHQLSGGEAQRAALAMALACRPRLLVVDEATTGLDLVTRAHLLGLLRGLAAEDGLGVLLISHDLPMLGTVSDRIAVMYAGRIAEDGPAGQLLADPAHPYTAALVKAAGSVGDPGSRYAPHGLAGDPPDPAAVPGGCAFRPRCGRAVPECADRRPLPRAVASGHEASCHLAVAS
jgi:peptide/nickel transport system ATP-binding protein